MVNEVTKNGMTDCGEILAEAENGKIITDSTEWWMFAESVGQSLILCKPQIWLQNDNII